MQGYLPIAILANAIKAKTVPGPGFYNSGTQIVTADSVDMGNGLPAISYDEALKLAGDPAATAAYYKAWTESLTPEFSTDNLQEFIDWERQGLYVLERGEGECAV